MRFQDVVAFDSHGLATTAGSASAASAQDIGSAERVVGVYDHVQREVRMTKASQTWLNAFRYFGQPMSEELLKSIHTHEIAHALSKAFYANGAIDPEKGIRVQEEYIAYAAQLWGMSENLRAKILQDYPTRRFSNFEGEHDIHDFHLGMAPEAFGVKAYRHVKTSQGGAEFLDRIYSGEFKPMTIWMY